MSCLNLLDGCAINKVEKTQWESLESGFTFGVDEAVFQSCFQDQPGYIERTVYHYHEQLG